MQRRPPPVAVVDVGGEEVEGGRVEQGEVWCHHHAGSVEVDPEGV